MAAAIRPALLRRYRDIALLLVRYGRGDLLRTAFGARLEDGEGGDNDVAERFAADLEKLGPTFIKLGQVLSTRPDLLPPAYLQALSRLQDAVEPFPFSDVERIFEAEVGARLSKTFRHVDPEPLAAASLAQVHRAVTRDGRLVALKVQRPGLVERVREDLDALAEIASIADAHSDSARRLQLVDMFDEFRRSLLRELDLRNEARNQQTIGASLADFDLIVVPQPVDDFTTSRVLTMDFAKGRKITQVGPLARLELDGVLLAGQFFRAYLKQVLVDGFFHADPHPGNVMLTDDGRIALVDLGMVARIGGRTREHLLKLLMAVAEGNSDEAAKIGVAMGETERDFDEGAFHRQVMDLVGDAGNLEVDRIEVGSTLLQVTRLASAAGLKLPIELTMLGKALLNLDQVALVLDPSFNPSTAIREHAPDLVRHRLTDELSPGRLFAGALEARDLVQMLPARLNKILEHLAGNDLRINVHAFDEARFLAGLHKIANRITAGLVLSALIVGAALLTRVETPNRILGYPALAIVCFGLAFTGGLMLLWTIWRDRDMA